MDQNHVAGIIVGAIVGLYKATIAVITLMFTYGMLTWSNVLDTASLALLGGAAGWCGAELMKWIKKIYKNRKK